MKCLVWLNVFEQNRLLIFTFSYYFFFRFNHFECFVYVFSIFGPQTSSNFTSEGEKQITALIFYQHTEVNFSITYAYFHDIEMKTERI